MNLHIYTYFILPKLIDIKHSILIDFFEQLKPELIAPVVMWLCHEKCTENGSIIESAIGWTGKCKCMFWFKVICNWWTNTFFKMKVDLYGQMGACWGKI